MRHLWMLVVSFGLGTMLRAEPELFTNVYVVPPTFNTDGTTGLPRAGGVKNTLESAGIAFGPGASAIYNAATSQLIVRNTRDQMELVEAYIEAIKHGVEKQILVSVLEASFQGELSECLKNDSEWPGGAPLMADELSRLLFEFPEPSAGRKDGEDASRFDSLASFMEELARPPKSVEQIEAERQIAQTGSLTDPQFQVLVRQLAKVKAIEIRSFPPVTARSGQPTIVQKAQCRYGVVPVLGADEFTIDLNLFLPEHGKGLVGEGTSSQRPTVHATMPDGGTLVVAEKTTNGANRLVFVKAHILDAAGMPTQKKAGEAVELPSKSKPQPTSPKKAPEEDRTAERSGHDGVHIVREDETLESIAHDYGVGTDALLKANRLGCAPVKPGQLLLVPPRLWVESRTEELLKSLVLPGLDFKRVSLARCLAMVQRVILERHDPDLFPEAAPILIADVPETVLDTEITLRLTNVPATEALRYITALASCRYEVTGREVRIVPLDAEESDAADKAGDARR